MLRFLADENFNGPLLRAARGRDPTFAAVTVQELAIRRIDDPSLLQRAADDGLVVLSHDADTLIGFAAQRLRAGQPMPGLVEVKCVGGLAAVVDDPLLVAACDPADIDGQVWFIPLR